MPPLLHLMRHGQGYHSADVTKDGHLLHDPHLTEKGKEQCRARCEAFDRHDKVELLVCSPLKRTIETCSIAFAPETARGLPLVALPDAIEVTTDPCDSGSPAAELAAEFDREKSGFTLDLTHVEAAPDAWLRHEGDWAPDPALLKQRARRLRRWLRARPEREVVLVSHGQFAHFLTGDVDGEGHQTTAWWSEAELRTYHFAEDDEEDAQLVETGESLQQRGGRKPLNN